VRLALLAACCTLVVFAGVNVVASAWVWLDLRSRRPRWRRRSASGLLFWRCLPATVSATLAGLIVLPAFLVHEPRDRVETVGLPLALSAALGLAIFAAGPIRGLIALVRTRALVRRWLGAARPAAVPGWSGPAWIVEPDAAGVAVVGFVRPALVVSRGVLAACTARELAGIVAHERAHAEAHDNWKKALVRCLPDVLGWTREAAALDRLREQRAEEEADVAATREDRTIGVEIAAALVKVARGRRRVVLPAATAFGAGGPIARRVRLLLAEPPPALEERRPWLVLSLGILAAAVWGGVPTLSVRVHAAVEALVQLLT
jgi:hypothetical protein